MERTGRQLIDKALQALDSCRKGWRKRVLSSASRQGSLTVEAALVLPLFVFASVCLMLPMRMMDVHRKVQTVLEVSAEDMSAYLYFKHRTAGEEEREGDGEKAKDGEKMLAGLLAEGYLRGKVRAAVGEKMIEGLTFYGTEIMEDGEHVRLRAEYRFILPFSVLRLKSVPMTAVSIRRAWIGREGDFDFWQELWESEKDQTVYVGKGRGRYHWFKDCHYLDNKVLTVSWEELEGKRNQSGARYRSCSVCGGGVGGTVYLMESGESYHRNRYCSSIIAYVEAVPLSQVKGLGACSYCGRMKGE